MRNHVLRGGWAGGVAILLLGWGVLRISSTVLGSGGAAASQERMLAFPTAEGFGRFARGGRGGRVIEVTNLNDSGPGSLRAALAVSGPRTVVFRVGGTIDLKSELIVNHPYVTIAGQTAPGDGVVLKDRGLSVRTWEVIVGYLRVRSGPASLPAANGGIFVGGPDPDIHPAGATTYNVIVDHCSVSWGTDDMVSAWGTVRDVTFQWNIIAEGLNCGNEVEGCGSRGLLTGAGATNVSVHHNLFAHVSQRTPAVGGNGDIVNNVSYNYWTQPIQVSPYTQPDRLNIVANYFKAGRDSDYQYPVIRLIGDTEFSDRSRVYVHGNLGPGRADTAQPEDRLIWQDNGGLARADNRLDFPRVTSTDARAAYEQVLAGAGATLPARDPVDRRVVEDVRNGTGRVIGYPSDVGGWPVYRAGPPPADTER